MVILTTLKQKDILKWQMNDRQALFSEKRFLSPRRGSNLQPSDDRWDAQTIELPKLRWWAKVHVSHMCDLSGSHYMLIMILMIFIYFEKCVWELGDIVIYLEISLSLGSSIVTMSQQSSSSCGFDPRLELRNRAWRPFIYHLIIRLWRQYCSF